MHRVLLGILAATVGYGCAPPTVLPSDVALPVTASWVSARVRDMDVIGGQQHLENLRRSGPGRAWSVRVWIGWGVMLPGFTYEFQQRGDRIRPRLVLWWHTDLVEVARSIVRRGDCGPLLRGVVWTTCQLPLHGDPAILLAQLDSLGINTLPDPSSLQEPESSFIDGHEVIIEVRTPNGYRIYRYPNPEFQPWPSAAHVAKIEALVTSWANAQIH